MSGLEKYRNIIYPVLIVGASIIFIAESVRSYNLRKIFDFRKELKNLKINTSAISREQTGTLIGYTGMRPVYVPDNARHVFVCGTTGSGKTVALSNFIKNVIDNDFPALIIDGKGDIGKGSILDIINKINRNKKVYVINLSDPENSDKYNPFKNSTPTVAKDMLINMSDWSEEHYKLNAERYIQRILQLLKISNTDLSFGKIVKSFSVDNFIELSAKLTKQELITKEMHLENLEIAKTSGKTAQNSTARFSVISESEIGHIFSDNGIDISEALQQNAIILFILNPLVYPELSPAFGRLILIDAKKSIGTLFKVKIPKTFFIMDEISTYATTGLTDLVNKSRSAGVTCVLATQSLSDLDFSCGEAYKEQIIENCNNYLIMRQNSGVNAEHWANILGTRSTMDVTYQLQQNGLDTSETGYGSTKRVREYLFHPDDIKKLQTGKGIYLSRDGNFNCKLNINKPFEE